MIAKAPIASTYIAGTITPASGQLLRPIADIAANGWLPSAGSDLWAMLDEVAPNDADFIFSPDNPTTQQFEVKLSAGAGVHSSYIARIRYEAVSFDTNFDLNLVQGITVLDSWSETLTVAEGATTRVHTSSSVSITDASNLRVRGIAKAP